MAFNNLGGGPYRFFAPGGMAVGPKNTDQTPASIPPVSPSASNPLLQQAVSGDNQGGVGGPPSGDAPGGTAPSQMSTADINAALGTLGSMGFGPNAPNIGGLAPGNVAGLLGSLIGIPGFGTMTGAINAGAKGLASEAGARQGLNTLEIGMPMAEGARLGANLGSSAQAATGLNSQGFAATTPSEPGFGISPRSGGTPFSMGLPSSFFSAAPMSSPQFSGFQGEEGEEGEAEGEGQGVGEGGTGDTGGGDTSGTGAIGDSGDAGIGGVGGGPGGAGGGTAGDGGGGTAGDSGGAPGDAGGTLRKGGVVKPRPKKPSQKHLADRLKQGGTVNQGNPNSKKDDVPVKLSRGEYVEPREATQKFKPQLDMIRQAALSKGGGMSVGRGK